MVRVELIRMFQAVIKRKKNIDCDHLLSTAPQNNLKFKEEKCIGGKVKRIYYCICGVHNNCRHEEIKTLGNG